MSRHFRPGCRSAFTLVELLVVIGIIALLISILLPALNRVRKSAKSVVCLSNVRQLGVAYTFYANENNQYAPVGHVGPSRQYNYPLYVPFSPINKTVGAGFLNEAGLIEAPEAFYCPSEAEPSVMYDTDVNPWRPAGLDASTPSAEWYGKAVRLGYSTRPITRWSNVPSGDYTLPDKFPKLFRDFRGKAMLSDLTTSARSVQTRHEDKLNVLYGDSSGRTVDYAVIATPIEAIIPGSFTANASTNNPLTLIPDGDVVNGLYLGAPVDAIWNNLDDPN